MSVTSLRPRGCCRPGSLRVAITSTDWPGRLADSKITGLGRGCKMTDAKVLREVLRTAIQRESDSKALYMHIAKEVKAAEARAKFERLAEMEQGHRDTVERIYAGRFGAVDFQPKPAALPDLSNEKTMHTNAAGALKMAIKKEKEAQEFYRNLAEQLGDNEGRDLCGKMEEEERSHQKLIEDELRVLSNQFYWYPILDTPWNIREDL